MSRGKIQAPKPSGTSPLRAKISIKRAVSEVITKSLQNAKCAPMPAAVPFTAAITGISQSITEFINLILPSSIIRRISPVMGSMTPSEVSLL